MPFFTLKQMDGFWKKTSFQFLIFFTVNGTFVYETGPIW